jgi:hypothetical protein
MIYWELLYHLSSHSSFGSIQPIITVTRLELNSLNIYRSETCFGEKLKHTFYVHLTVSEINEQNRATEPEQLHYRIVRQKFTGVSEGHTVPSSESITKPSNPEAKFSFFKPAYSSLTAPTIQPRRWWMFLRNVGKLLPDSP